MQTPATIRRATMKLAFGQAVASASIPLNATLGSIIVGHLSHSTALSGTAVGAAMLAGVLALIFAPRIGDDRGRRPLLITGFTLLGTGATIDGVAVIVGSYALFMVGCVVFGLGAAMAQLCRSSAADLYPVQLRGKGVGAVASAGAVGAVAGPLLATGAAAAGALGGIDRDVTPWFVLPLICAAAVFVILTLRPDPKEIASRIVDYFPDAAPPPPLEPPRPRAELLSLPPARKAIRAASLCHGAMVGVMGVTAVALNKAGDGSATIALLMSAHFIGMFALAVPIGGLADRFGRQRTILVGACVCGVGAIGTALSISSPLLPFFFFLLGLGWCGAFVAGTSMIADVTRPNERVRVVAVNDLGMNLTAGVAVLAAGPLLASVGFTTVGICGAVLASIAAVGMLGLREEKPGTYTSTAPAKSDPVPISDAMKGQLAAIATTPAAITAAPIALALPTGSCSTTAPSTTASTTLTSRTGATAETGAIARAASTSP